MLNPVNYCGYPLKDIQGIQRDGLKYLSPIPTKTAPTQEPAEIKDSLSMGMGSVDSSASVSMGSKPVIAVETPPTISVDKEKKGIGEEKDIKRSPSPSSEWEISCIPDSCKSYQSPAQSPSNLLSIPQPTMRANLLNLPDTRQSTDYSCGASALQSVLMYWGQEYMETDLMRMLGTDPQNGTAPQNIVKVAQDLGFQAKMRENLTIKDLEDSISRGEPVIIDAQAWREGAELNRPWSQVWDSGHYMVVVGTDEKNVYFEDPSILGSIGFIPRDELMDRWHDVDDKKRYQLGIFIKGEKPVPLPQFLRVD